MLQIGSEREEAEVTEVVGGENHSLSHSDGADRWPCRGGGDWTEMIHLLEIYKETKLTISSAVAYTS